MIFATTNAISDIIAGRKTQTRRLVKKYEFQHRLGTIFKGKMGKIPLRIKWQVGKSYAVQSGRGKPGVWYCPKCQREVVMLAATSDALWVSCGCYKQEIGNIFRSNDLKAAKFAREFAGWKPLRIRITKILKQRLLNINETDAKKEGFDNSFEFFKAFQKINGMEKTWGKSIKEPDFLIPRIKGFNPEIWVLEFEVVK